MSDTSERLDRFDRALEQIGHRSSTGDRRWSIVGLVSMAAGTTLALVAYFVSTSQTDHRDVISFGILASVGVCMVIAGAAVFIRYSVSEFLRFWLLRVLLAQEED